MEAVGVVSDLVVVRVSKTKAASDNLVDKGVDEKERMEESRWDLIVVFPEPDSPLVVPHVSNVSMDIQAIIAGRPTERQSLDFPLALPASPKLFRPGPQPRP